MSVLLMLILISVLIITHEFGHFFVAKWSGVKVERFGFGLPIGAPIWSTRVGGTEVCLHWLLFGGYVAFPDDNPDSDIPEDSPQRFENQPLLNRAAIALAGITVNALTAFLLLWVVYSIYGVDQTAVHIRNTVREAKELAVVEPAELSPWVSQAFSEKTQTAGFGSVEQPFTPMVMTVDGLPVTGAAPFSVVKDWMSVKPGFAPHTVTIYGQTEASGALSRVELKPSNAAVNGLYGGEQILAVAGESLKPYGDPTGILILTIRQHAGETIDMEVLSAEGYPKTIAVTPDAESGTIGVSLLPVPTRHFIENPVEGVMVSADILGYMVVQNFKSLFMLASGSLGAEHLSGPIRIVDMGAKVIDQRGMEYGLILTALISMILAVMNLIPFPPLDGFHLVLIGWEAIFKKPMNRKVQESVMTFGYLSLLLLMGFVVFNDIKMTFF